VLAAGGSRTVKTLLLRAADRHVRTWGAPRFRVIYVMDGSGDSGPAVAALREKSVPVATIEAGSVAHALEAGKVDMVFVGTEVVVQNGGLLSRMGTYQLAQLAKAMGKPLYVAAESHKIVRLYPLGQADLERCGIKQHCLDFRTAEDVEPQPCPDSREPAQAPVDYTVSRMYSTLLSDSL
jgi:translation initiation factor eIF-2B subunit alpha